MEERGKERDCVAGPDTELDVNVFTSSESDKLQPLHVRLPSHILSVIEEKAETNGISKAKVVRKLLDEALSNTASYRQLIDILDQIYYYATTEETRSLAQQLEEAVQRGEVVLDEYG